MSVKSITFVCLIIFCEYNLYAQELLNPITITASRVAVPINDVSGSLTIISKEEITRRNAVYVADLLQGVAGLNVSKQGGIGSLTQIRLRGAEANQVLVLIDGIEVNDPASASEFNFAHLSVADIERIEILRGPQSSLWGSDALAGVINIITSRAQEGSQLVATGSYGSENSIKGGLNLSHSTETYDFALSGNFIDTKGINIATSGSERDGYENSTLNLNSTYRPLDNLEFGLGARYTNATNEFDPAPLSLPIDGAGEIDVEQVYGRLFARLNLFADHWIHQVEATITDTSNDNQDELFGDSKTEGSKEKFVYQTTIHLPTTKILQADQSIVVALEREQERFQQVGAAFPGFDPNQRQKITNYSQVIEYRALLHDRLTLSAAYRHDDNDEFDNQSTYRVGINYYHPISNTKVYLTHATGAKNPTFTEIFGFFPASFIGNPELDAEQSESWELGLTQGLFDDRMQVDVAFFREDLIDEIQTIFLPSFETTVINSNSRSDRNGLEVAVRGELNDSISVATSYTYLDSKQPDNLGNNHTEIRRPRNQWSGQLNYSFLGNKANLNVNIDYIGKRRDIDFSTNTRVSLDEYTRVDIALSYQLSNSVKMFAQLRNILDEEYQDVFGFETEEFAGFAGLEISL